MALRGVKPTAIEKRLKMMVYGPPGSWKTSTAIQFPAPYLIDTERGAENKQYVEQLEKSGGAIFQTSDFDEMRKEVKALLSEKHDFKTLVIDPVTIANDDAASKAEVKVGNQFGRHYGEAKKQWKQLNNLLLRLDMNVVVNSHQKKEYDDKMQVIGMTYDGPKGIDYLFDLVIQTTMRDGKSYGIVRKTRIPELPLGSEFPFTYTEIAKRFGKKVIEKSASTQQLATDEQVAELTRLVDLLKIPTDTTDKWLDKANASDFTELPSDAISKCIEWCHGQIKKGAA